MSNSRYFQQVDNVNSPSTTHNRPPSTADHAHNHVTSKFAFSSQIMDAFYGAAEGAGEINKTNQTDVHSDMIKSDHAHFSSHTAAHITSPPLTENPSITGPNFTRR